MNIKNNISLKKLNSFNINTIAKYFIEIKNENELIELINNYNFTHKKYFILGNGTNILFANDLYDGLVIKNNNKNILNFEINENNIIVTASSGIDYEILIKKYFDFLNQNNLKIFSGLENLSQIPTSIGASVVQNVGAYGVEQNNFFFSCSAINLFNGEKKIFYKEECNFSYRNSIFKQFSNYFITEVKYFISLNNVIPNLNYTDFNKFNDSNNIVPEMIYDFIAEIRANKIPSHIDFHNCGSFFKNPIVNQATFDFIIQTNPNIINYKNENGIKLSAANLIENCGLKGFRIGEVGISDKHSLFIINYGNATGKDVINFMNIIISKVFDKYGIKLVPEVVIVK